MLLGDDEPSHVGHVEGGLGGSQANASYFLLVPNGGHLTAVPVKEWYNFKPAPKYAGRLLSISAMSTELESAHCVSQQGRMLGGREVSNR